MTTPANYKKLINFTPQYRDTTAIAAAAAAQTTCLDGLLLDFRWTSPTFGFSEVQKTWLHADAMAWADISAQVTNFQAISWGRLTDNFVRVRLQPGYDNATEFWNDPAKIASSVNNIGLIARAAREIGAKGIFWDCEAYHTDIQHRMLHYASLKAGFTLAQRQAQVRAAMAQMAAAVWANFPDCIIFLMFGYEEMYSSPYYDLLGASVEGIMDASPTTKIPTSPSLFHVVNGNENCYYANTIADWNYWYNSVYEAHRAAGGTFHPKYAENISLSGGIWLDRYDAAPYDAFSLVDFTWNYYDPLIARAGHASWQQVVGHAFDYADSFVWLFTENNVGYLGMPAAYQSATDAAVAAHRTARTEYQHRCLMVVSAAARAAANAACASIGLDPIFAIPLTAVGDPAGTAPKWYMADVEASESVYRGITVMVPPVGVLRVSPDGNYDDPYQVILWLYDEGMQLVPTNQCDPCVCPEMYYRSNDTFKKAVLTLLCFVREIINYIYGYLSGATPPTTPATFSALSYILSGNIIATYTSVINLPDHTRAVILDNQTDGDVYVSMDGGVTDTYHMTPGEKDFLDLAAIGITTTAEIQVRDGVMPSANGRFFVYSIL